MSKVSGCQTLEELADFFQMKLTNINQCVQLRDSMGDPAVQSMMSGLGRSLTELETILTLMRAEIRQRRAALTIVDDMKKKTLSLRERIDHASENIPARIPKKQAANTDTSSNKENKEPQPGQPTPRKPLTESSQNTNGGPVETKKKVVKSGKAASIPSLDYLTVVEFDSIPKYMKGRLTYDKVNTAVDELNKALSGKYTLLATKRSAQNDFIKKKIVSYKEEETKDTKGVQFITEKDTKEYSSLKVDSVCRSLLTILRHCGRIREIRGGGTTRLAVCH